MDELGGLAVTPVTELERAFAERLDGLDAGDAPVVGLFGAGLPATLVRSAGAMVVDVKAPPLADATDGPRVTAVDSVAEPFLDDFTARFLHRLAAGAFDALSLIVFARGDVAALAAYQYATEMRRLGMIEATGPRFHLWNMVHSDSAAAAAYNRTELARLDAVLDALVSTDRDFAAAQASEARRAAALARVPAGPDGFVWRNAGRWMTPEAHADLLSQLPETAPPASLRIALVGTACDIPVLHRICTCHGNVVADLQPYGHGWERAGKDAPDAAALLAAIAADPLHVRANPPARYSRALREAVAGCDVIVASVDRNDDSFGWDIPMLAAHAAKTGRVFVNLGFRPFRPGADWIAAAETTLAEALA